MAKVFCETIASVVAGPATLRKPHAVSARHVTNGRGRGMAKSWEKDHFAYLRGGVVWTSKNTDALDIRHDLVFPVRLPSIDKGIGIVHIVVVARGPTLVVVLRILQEPEADLL